MSSSQRLTFLAIAAVIAVVAVVVLSGGSGDSGEEQAAAPTQTQTPTPESEGMAEESEATATPTPEPTPTPDPIPVLRPGTRKTVEAKQGERVRFRIRSPEAEEMHLHGYDVYRDLPAGKTVTVTLDDPQLTGIYEIELHNSGEEIGALKVEPE